MLPELNEINFGRYEGGPLAAYREWAWTTAADVDCPGGGESRTATATRVANALDWLLARPEETVLLVGHALAAPLHPRRGRGSSAAGADRNDRARGAAPALESGGGDGGRDAARVGALSALRRR